MNPLPAGISADPLAAIAYAATTPDPVGICGITVG